MDGVEFLQKLIVWAPGVIFAITLHEWAHGFAAYRFGDPTAASLGRLSLNPLAHVDWVWTVAVPIVLLLTMGFAFGAAKPVPINPRNFRGSYKFAMFWVATAGPLMNLFLALVCALGLRLVGLLPAFFAEPLFQMLQAGIVANVVLAVFNMFPVPPLDGGRVAVALLPPPLDRHWAGLERFGLPLIMILAFSGLLGRVVQPAVSLFFDFYMTLAGLVT
ncbi:MAG: site-2 protease family protein [Magnetococcales bacterium]|nr:site-2 protease family protein [Magnetococcales bacterium]